VPELKGSQESRVLKGPFSPLEMQVRGKIQSLSGYHARIEDDSVNSVLLDDQPEGRHERVLVAAQVIPSFFPYPTPLQFPSFLNNYISITYY